MTRVAYNHIRFKDCDKLEGHNPHFRLDVDAPLSLTMMYWLGCTGSGRAR